MIAIACAVATGPLLASAAIGIRDYVTSAPDDEGFSLDGGGFIDPGSGGGLSPNCVWDGYTCVVTADWGSGGYTFSGGFGAGGGSQGGSSGDCSADPSRCEGGENQNPTDCTNVEINETALGPRTPRIQATLEKLKEQFQLAMQRLGGMPENSRFVFNNGTSVSAGELYGLLARVDFIIDPDNADWSSFAPGANGVVYMTPDGPVYRIKISYLEANLANEDAAQRYIFHEISHMTTAGVIESNTMYLANSPGGHQITPAERSANEHWTESFQFAIRTAIGFPPAPGSFTESERQSAPGYDPGGGASGPTVAQAVTVCPGS